MFPRPLRFVLIGISTAFGLYYALQGQAVGFLYLFASLLLVYGYFRYGPVWIAFHHVRRKNHERARSLLAQVRDPELLSTRQRSYYEFASAELAAQKGDYALAERHLRTALDHQLRSENDRALAETMLAELLIRRGARDEARGLLERARRRAHDEETTRLIEQVTETLSETAGPRDETAGSAR